METGVIVPDRTGDLLDGNVIYFVIMMPKNVDIKAPARHADLYRYVVGARRSNGRVLGDWAQMTISETV